MNTNNSPKPACPDCGSTDTIRVSAHPRKSDGGSVRRLFRCFACGGRFPIGKTVKLGRPAKWRERKSSTG